MLARVKGNRVKNPDDPVTVSGEPGSKDAIVRMHEKARPM